MILGLPAFAQQPPTATPPSPAPLRMAFVDLLRVAAESNEGKAANAKIQALTQKKQAELKEKTSSLEANRQKLQQGGGALSDAARAQIQKDIDRLTVEIDRFQEDANAEVQELQQQVMGEFQEKLRPVVDAIVKELAIGLLFSWSDAGAIFVDPSLDITADVVKRFNAATVSGATKPAAGAKPTTPPATSAKPAAPPAAPPATQKPTPPPATDKPATPPAPAPAKP
jgi:outer membrane protein